MQQAVRAIVKAKKAVPLPDPPPECSLDPELELGGVCWDDRTKYGYDWWLAECRWPSRKNDPHPGQGECVQATLWTYGIYLYTGALEWFDAARAMWDYTYFNDFQGAPRGNHRRSMQEGLTGTASQFPEFGDQIP